VKVIEVNYNLQNNTQTPKATLSDLFILLYSIYLLEEKGANPSILTLNKLYPFIFQKLEEKNELDKLQVFNLPFYKMDKGHYNKSLKNNYLARLLKANLIEKGAEASYKLKSETKRMISGFHKELGANDYNKEFVSLVTEYITLFIEGRNYNDVYNALHDFSHGSIVEKEGKKISVHELATDDNLAIAYNSPDFKVGKPSNLVPTEYLTLLGYMLQENVKPNESSKELVETLLQSSA